LIKISRPQPKNIKKIIIIAIIIIAVPIVTYFSISAFSPFNIAIQDSSYEYNCTGGICINPDVEKITQSTMQGVSLACYIYNDPQTNSPEVKFYNQTILSIYNDKLITNPSQFINQPSFQEYVFNHCPYFTGNANNVPDTFNSTLADYNHRIATPGEIIQLVSTEQKLTDYNFSAIALHNPRIESTAQFFGMDLPQVVSQLFQNKLLSMDKCINPSWNKNSTIRECVFNDSHIVVDRQGNLMGLLDSPIVSGKNNV
jgi:hypothetical protein